MRTILLAAAVVGVIAATADVGFIQATLSPRPSIQGVWKITELMTTGANATKNSNPQPSLYIFTARHYSTIVINGTQARLPVPAFKNPDEPTDAEKLAMYDMVRKSSAFRATRWC